MKYSLEIRGLTIKSPFVTASGTAGFGLDLPPEIDLRQIGALTTKTITLLPREGNYPPRVWEVPSGILNSIGLQNPGFEVFASEVYPLLRDLPIPVIASIGGSTFDEYVEIAKAMDSLKEIPAIELNVSCPNVKEGGIQFGTDPGVLGDLVSEVRKAFQRTLIVKLTPNVTSIVPPAAAAARSGADALSLINTVKGAAIDPISRKPRLNRLSAGLSGPAIKPIAVNMIWEAFNAVEIPIIGMGGITSGLDVAEFMLAGASAVAIGSSSLVDPLSFARAFDELEQYLMEQQVESALDLVGAVLHEGEQG